jgi:AAA+ ATPase superfamily predicted ATPase
MFVDRVRELAFLNSLLHRTQPTAAHMVLLYGRRRVGKTVLARHWAESTDLPTLYWAAEREPANLQRRKLFAKMIGMALNQTPAFESWADLWEAFANLIGDQRRILVIDEVTYAAESDEAFLSALQHAWDQRLKQSQLILILSGSHVHTMETLLARGSPLFGRFTGQWHLEPLSFGTLREFLPKWSVDERIAAYAMIGGVPAYLERLIPERSLVDNIRDVILDPGGMFVAEPELLLYDEVRDPRVYQAILQAIGAGAHTLNDIANTTLISKTHLSSYLARLQEIRFVERRLPTTIPPQKIRLSRMGRYHLTDPFLRFYFHFVAPQRSEVGYQQASILSLIKEQLRAFVGVTAYEELCRAWVATASQSGQLPFEVQQVGSHWSRNVQVDVVGVNWHTKSILLGECKWGTDRVPREVVTELIENKTLRVLTLLPNEGQSWSVHHALFSRAGFTPAAQTSAEEHEALLVNLNRMESDLA